LQTDVHLGYVRTQEEDVKLNIDREALRAIALRTDACVGMDRCKTQAERDRQVLLEMLHHTLQCWRDREQRDKRRKVRA
jgi:hypothetical protein